MADVTFEQVETPEQNEQAGILIREYLAGLNDRLIQDYRMPFDAEVMVRSDLDDRQKFHPPDGRFYLAGYDSRIAGVGCLKRLDAEAGEIQGMYVSPDFRGKRIGWAIANRLIDVARAIGYRRLRLESLEFPGPAHALYRSLGFRDIDPYQHNSMESYQSAQQLNRYYRITVFMELDL